MIHVGREKREELEILSFRAGVAFMKAFTDTKELSYGGFSSEQEQFNKKLTKIEWKLRYYDLVKELDKYKKEISSVTSLSQYRMVSIGNTIFPLKDVTFEMVREALKATTNSRHWIKDLLDQFNDVIMDHTDYEKEDVIELLKALIIYDTSKDGEPVYDKVMDILNSDAYNELSIEEKMEIVNCNTYLIAFMKEKDSYGLQKKAITWFHSNVINTHYFSLFPTDLKINIELLCELMADDNILFTLEKSDYLSKLGDVHTYDEILKFTRKVYSNKLKWGLRYLPLKLLIKFPNGVEIARQIAKEFFRTENTNKLKGDNLDLLKRNLEDLKYVNLSLMGEEKIETNIAPLYLELFKTNRSLYRNFKEDVDVDTILKIIKEDPRQIKVANEQLGFYSQKLLDYAIEHSNDDEDALYYCNIYKRKMEEAKANKKLIKKITQA